MVNTNTPDKPPYVTGENPNSFAAFTIRERLPHIIHSIIRDNTLSDKQEDNLNDLLNQVTLGQITRLESIDDNVSYWLDFNKEYAESHPKLIPFFSLEAYFYARIEHIINGHSQSKIDPFLEGKKKNLDLNLNYIDNELKKIINEKKFKSDSFLNILLSNLYGNTADLSQLKTNTLSKVNQETLVIDKTATINQYLSSNFSFDRFDLIADNAGLELSMDLILIYYLLHTNKVSKFYLHLKSYPTFVSDATIDDFYYHVNYFSTSSTTLKQFSSQLLKWIEAGRFIVVDDEFWNSPLHFINLPENIQNEFKQSDLLIFKGDANYRRLFEDRLWSYERQTSDLLTYLEAPSVMVRMLKSEILLGADFDSIQRVKTEDNRWLVEGKVGLIDFWSQKT